MKRVFGNKYIAIAILFAAAFLVYSPTLFNGFVYDDNVQILENRWMKDIRYLGDIFLYSTWSFVDGTTPGGNFYRPVMHLVYMAEYHIFGLSPVGFHLVNIILHAINSVMVFIMASLLLSECKDKEAAVFPDDYLLPLLAGLFFALHPVNTEVVSWVAAVPELTLTFFYILAFYLYAVSGIKGSKSLYVLSVVFYFFALFCKETPIVLPAMLFAYDYFKKGRRALKKWFVYLPYLAAALVYMALRRHAVGGLAHHKELTLTNYEWVINTFPTMAKYIYKLILPLNLNAMYEFDTARSFADPKVLLAFFVILILASLFVILMRKRHILFVMLSWIFIPLLPVMYLPALIQGFADRYMYLSTAGFGVLAAYGIGKAASYVRSEADSAGAKKVSAAVVSFAVAVLALYSAGTVKRSLVWREDYTLWADTIEKSPGLAKAHFNLGWTLHKKGDIEGAIIHYKDTIRLDPNDIKAYYNLAMLYAGKKDYKNAVINYREAIRLDPGKAEKHYNLAMAYHLSGDLPDAIGSYNEAIRINPGYENAHFNLASAYEEMGDSQSAAAHYSEVIRINPRSADAYYNLGVIYEKNGYVDLSIEEFESALRVDPGYGSARRELEKVLAKRPK